MTRFSFDPTARYRMPVLFGPTVGPRQGPQGQTFDGTNAAFTVMSVRFSSDADALERFLPEGFSLSEPAVTVEHTVLHDLEWLAGRSYSMLGVKLPVVFEGAEEKVTGPLLTVLWENRAEPILSGREELGFNKLFCDLPEPETVGNSRRCRASWDGFEFFRMTVSGLAETAPSKSVPVDGTLHYAYMPPMGRDGPHEDRARVMLSPTPAVPARVDRYQVGVGELSFSEARFEDMPTMFHIVNALASLPINEIDGAFVLRGRGKGDLSDQREVARRGG